MRIDEVTTVTRPMVIALLTKLIRIPNFAATLKAVIQKKAAVKEVAARLQAERDLTARKAVAIVQSSTNLMPIQMHESVDSVIVELITMLKVGSWWFVSFIGPAILVALVELRSTKREEPNTQPTRVEPSLGNPALATSTSQSVPAAAGVSIPLDIAEVYYHVKDELTTVNSIDEKFDEVNEITELADSVRGSLYNLHDNIEDALSYGDGLEAAEYAEEARELVRHFKQTVLRLVTQ